MAAPWEKYATHPAVDRIINVESGGNPQARNSRSSAAGPGQFIDATWQQFITERHPQRLASGEDIFALKTDPNLGREATDWYAKKNQSFLQNRGLPTDPGAVYLAHFAGPAGAENLFRASPEASAADVLGREAIAANPHLAGMTAGDVQNWARGKMGSGGETQIAGPWVKYGGQDAASPQGELFEAPEQAPGPWSKYSAPPGAASDAGGLAAPRQEPGMGGDVPVPAAPAGEAGVGGLAPPVVEEQGLFETYAPDFLQRSLAQMQTRNVMLRAMSGAIDLPTASQQFAELVKEQEAIPERQSYVEGAKAWARKNQGLAPEYEGVSGALRFAKDHPLYVAEAVGESSLQTVEGVGMGLAGAGVGSLAGPIGTGVGFATGLSTSSGMTEGVSKFMETLSETGIDVTNEESLQGAFANPELMAEARRKAMAKGLTVAAFDGITSFAGIRGAGKHLADGFGKVIGTQAVKKSQARQAVEEGAATMFLIEAPGGMAGEAFGEMAAGDPVDNIAVMMEGAGEIALSGPQVGIQMLLPGGERQAKPATEKQIKGVFSAITNVPSYEEAEAEGRGWFGFVQQAYTQDGKVPGLPPSGPHRVYRDYTKAEEIMGQKEAAEGKLVAVTEDDITATSADAGQQVSNSSQTPTPRFTDPAREPEARRHWDKFVTEGGAENYRSAVKEGLRLAPLADHAEFVGDVTAAEITPKSEFPVAPDAFWVQAQGQSAPVAPANKARGLDLGKVLGDARFTVSLSKSMWQTLSKHGRKEQLAASLMEVTDPELNEIITNKGWSGFIDHMVSQPNPEQIFLDKKAKLLPSVVWGTRYSSGNGKLVVHSSLSMKETQAALEGYKPILPNTGVSGLPAAVGGVETHVPSIGGPFFERQIDITPVSPTGKQVSLHFAPGTAKDHRSAAEAMTQVVEKVLRGLGVKQKVMILIAGSKTLNSLRSQFNVTDQHWDRIIRGMGNFAGVMVPLASGDVLLIANPRGDISQTAGTVAHEFGHAISYFTMAHLPAKVQASIFAAYRRHVLTYRGPAGLQGAGTHQVRFGRQFAKGLANTVGAEANPYYISFEEWFAEQVARWSQTSAKPLSAQARYFRALGKHIVALVRAFKEWLNVEHLSSEKIIKDWLDSAYMQRPMPWSAGVQQTLIETTRAANVKHGIPVALQAESVKTHQVLDKYLTSPGQQLPNAPQHTAGAIKAQVDNLWWLKKWGFGFKQLAQTYPDVKPLQLYAELMKMSRLEVNNIMAEAEEILKQQIRPLRRVKTAGRSQADRLGDFLFDMTEMTYRTTDEVNRGVRRNPTQQEFTQLMRKHQLSDEAKQAYASLRDFFVKVVLRGEEVAIAEAQAVFANNPDQLKIAIATAKMMTSKLLNAPYFPMSRFGSWAVTVRTASGGIERFETYETKKEQQRALAEAGRQYPGSAGWSVTASTLPEEAQAFSGMPPWFLDKLAKLPGSTPEQQEWIQLLRYQVSPARSFRKHLLPRKRVAGYSRDIERVFAKYAFQHARHYGRIKYQRALEAQIKSLRAEHVQKSPGVHDVNLLNKMADFLENHYNDVMNPKADWHTARSITSVWYLGFMPSSAALNMTQTLLMTWPQLGLRFGDVKASGALMKASADLTNYYKRGTYEGMTAGHFKMLDFLIKRGDITESMAAELAGLAAGNSLDSYMGFSDTVHRGWLAFADKAMLMFKLVEQWNRRVTARAAYELAMGDINNKAVQDVKKEFFLQYQQMTMEGFGSDSEILATLFAGKIIDSTQFDYSKEARPRFMRGRKGLLFAFYMFTQNTVFQLTHKQNRGLFTRYALIMLFLAGPMGLLPEEGEDILNFVARRFFGKQFDLQYEARKLVNDLTGNPKWTDGILHGTGRHGFGIPAMIEMMGGPEVPEIDFSRLVELRNLAPLPISKGLDMVDRGPRAEKAMSNFVRDIAGAGFGIPFNLSMAMLDSELALSDIKRWERALPRALKKVVESSRRAYEGGERVGSNNYIMEYDKNSVADMAELAAHAMGFTSTRSAQAWDLSMAQREQSLFWTSQRQALLNSAFQAKFYYKDPESWRRAREDIQDFNKTVPDPKLRISGDTIKKSFQARRRSQQQFLKGDGPNVPPVLGRDIRKEFPDVRRVSERPIKTGG